MIIINWFETHLFIFQLASDGICRDFSQSYLDQATYTFEQKDGQEIVKEVKEKLSDYFNKKKRAAQVKINIKQKVSSLR